MNTSLINPTNFTHAESVGNLQRRPYIFSAEKQNWDVPELPNGMVGAHGTSLVTAIDLLRFGYFNRPNKALGNTFSLVPRYDYPGWTDKDRRWLPPEEYSAMQVAGQYALMQNPDDFEREVRSVADLGIVLTFSEAALTVRGISRYRFAPGTLEDWEYVPELILFGKPPDLDTVISIHAVGEEANDELSRLISAGVPNKS